MRSGQLVADRYRLEELIGSGGMGVVWRAVDTELGRVVAVKHARPGLARRGAEWLLREAKNAARVHHPNAVTLFDAVTEDADCWLVMEYVPAESLATTLDRNGPLAPRPAVRIAVQIAAALAALHASGIVHRDVKPGNVLVTEHGLAKLTDFGISRWAEETLTHSGPEPGTPAYQAPEVANGQPATSASDVYSLGATLFAIIEGQPLRDDELVSGVEPLHAVLGELLALDPTRRPTAEAARRMLGALADGNAVPAPDPAPASREQSGHERSGFALPGGTRSARTPRQLPAAPALFIGRRKELDRLDSALSDAADPCATVVISAVSGAGGIGKTWLALDWAHRHIDRFPDGQLFVDLRGFSPDSAPMNPATATRGFLDALGVEADRIPPEPHAQTALFRTLSSGRRMLLVLDNAADTEQVVPLLPGSGTCTVVVTSRNWLPGLTTGHSAHHLTVDILTDAEARALLVTRLGTARVDAESAAAADLIRLSGGFPLALSIIAGHAHSRPEIPLTAFATELREFGLSALDGEDPAASLPAVLSWSYQVLTSEQATVFTLLGIAPGPDIGLPAAACLTGLPPARTRAVLRDLEHASLLNRNTHDRYRMHDLIRHYAADTAHNLPEGVREAASRRVVDFYLHTAFTADRILYPYRQPIEADPPSADCHPQPLHDLAAASAWFGAEHACLLATQQLAAANGWPQAVWQLAWALNTFHRRQGYGHRELATWQTALATEHPYDPVVQSVIHRNIGDAHLGLGHHDEALGHLRQALGLAEQSGARAGQADAHQALSAVWERLGEDRRALDHAARALYLYQSLHDTAKEAEALNNLGWCSAQLDDYDQARAHCEAALALHRHNHNTEGEAATLDSLGYIAHHTGDHTQAVAYYHQALTLFRDLHNTYEEANTLENLGHTHAARGQHDQARDTWQQVLELYKAQHRIEDANRVQQRLDTYPTER